MKKGNSNLNFRTFIDEISADFNTIFEVQALINTTEYNWLNSEKF